MKIIAHLISGRVSSNSIEAQNLLGSQDFGKRDGDRVFYSLFEALFLVKSGKMEILDFRNKKMGPSDIEKKFERLDKNFQTKFVVFSDLRKKGYVVKTALKFGAEFRVYKRNSKKGDHARWILFPVSDRKSMTWHEFSAKNRIAHSTKKNLLIAVVDEEDDVSYYEVSWTRP